MSLLSDAVGVPAKLVESLATLPLALLDLQRSVDRLADVCEEMGREVKVMREGVDRLHGEVAVLADIREDVATMAGEVGQMRQGVDRMGPAVETLTDDLRRLPFIRRRGVA
jgi:uncharacterized protein YoxC